MDACFSFSAHCSRRVLHSFPTRRSSDLSTVTWDLPSGRTKGSVPLRRSSESLRTSLCASEIVRDRKSTRLNSSHGYISYAVFCLKKKKQVNVALLRT